jgi:hypothetical protein
MQDVLPINPEKWRNTAWRGGKSHLYNRKHSERATKPALRSVDLAPTGEETLTLRRHGSGVARQNETPASAARSRIAKATAFKRGTQRNA